MEDENKGDISKVIDSSNPLIEVVKKTFLEEFFPLSDCVPDAIFMSTEEVHQMMQTVCSDAWFSTSEVANWLHASGFNFCKLGESRYLWYMLKKPVNPVKAELTGTLKP